jgi:hypothetical protein
MQSKIPPLWQYPKCGERFVTRDMWHSCGTCTLEDLFACSEPHVFRLFNKFAEMVRACRRVTIIPQKMMEEGIADLEAGRVWTSDQIREKLGMSQ